MKLRQMSWCSAEYDGPMEAKSIRDSWYWSRRKDGENVHRWTLDNQIVNGRYAVVYMLDILT